MAKKPKAKVFLFSAFTQKGAQKLGLFYRDKMNKKILTNPTLNEKTTLWEITVQW